jgi:hypothetical protein
MRNPGTAIDKHQQINHKDSDQDEPADEDVRPETEHGLVLGKVGRGNVAGFVIVFVHAHKLRRKDAGMPTKDKAG